MQGRPRPQERKMHACAPTVRGWARRISKLITSKKGLLPELARFLPDPRIWLHGRAGLRRPRGSSRRSSSGSAVPSASQIAPSPAEVAAASSRGTAVATARACSRLSVPGGEGVCDGADGADAAVGDPTEVRCPRRIGERESRPGSCALLVISLFADPPGPASVLACPPTGRRDRPR